MAVFLMVLFIFVILLIHELGHYLGFLLTGEKIDSLIIGFPQLFCFKVANVTISVGLIPFMVIIVPTEEFLSSPIRKQFLVLILGSVFSLLFGLACIAVGIDGVDIKPFTLEFAHYLSTRMGFADVGFSPSIFGVVTSVIEYGLSYGNPFKNQLLILGLLSVCMLVNLLPLPSLDGGRILLLLFLIKRSKISDKIYQTLIIVSWILIIGLNVWWIAYEVYYALF